MQDVKDVVLVRSPYRELLGDGESALRIDQGMEHVGQEGDSWRSIWIRFGDIDTEFEDTRSIVALVNKQNPKPHCRTKKGAKQWSTGARKQSN